VYYNEPYFEHEFHESLLEPIIHEPQYIVKLVAPRKRGRDSGVKELLLVLAPLAALPLIGSMAMTTFTTLFATGGLGRRRRRRDLLTRELFSRSFTEVQPTDAGDYLHERLIGGQHNVGLESLLASGNFNAGNTGNTDRFGSQITPKSQVIGVKAKDTDNWRPIDTSAGNTRTGAVHKSLHKTSNGNESVDSWVKGFEERSPQMIRHSDLILAKGGKRGVVEESSSGNGMTALGAQIAIVEPIYRQQQQQQQPYMTSTQKSAYRSKTDFRPNLIVHPNNANNDSVSRLFHNENKGLVDNNLAALSKNSRAADPRLTDLSPHESATIVKRVGTQSAEQHRNPSPNNNNDNNKHKTNDFEFNSWIPFLSNPHLKPSDAVRREEGRRDIQDLDVIQKYLNSMGRPDYNDEIIATYLSCNGMLSDSNQCLERLTCQYSDTTGPLKPMEKDVSSLVIYSLLKNEHIDNGFKSRLQRAAFYGKDNPGK
ncbi:unnamed protein product, partial [Medioppia subpectinata]